MLKNNTYLSKQNIINQFVNKINSNLIYKYYTYKPRKLYIKI